MRKIRLRDVVVVSNKSVQASMSERGAKLREWIFSLATICTAAHVTNRRANGAASLRPIGIDDCLGLELRSLRSVELGSN